MADEIILRVRTEGVDDFIKNMKKAGVVVEDVGEEVQKTEKKVESSFGKIGKLIGGAFATAAVINFGKQLTKLAVQLDATDKKFKTVFGSASKQVEDFAKKNAASLGLTESQFKRAAAAAGDLLIPIGFQREQAAELSNDLVKLSGALAAWTGGQLNATEVSDILTKALLGEREQLKTLGINILEADVNTRLLEKGQKKLTGTMLAQAKAAATLELITEKSADAQAAFADDVKTLAEQQLELTASIKSIAESFARLFIPTINTVIRLATSLVNVFRSGRDEIKSLSDQFEEQNETLEKTESTLGPLLKRYDDLKSQSTLTEEEQAELQKTINSVVDIVPLAATGFNTYGEALDINRGKVDEFVTAQRELNRLLNIEAIEERRKDLAALSTQLERNEEIIEDRNKLAADTSNILTQNVIAQRLLLGSTKELGEENVTLRKEIGEALLQLDSWGDALSEQEQTTLKAYISTLTGGGSGGGGDPTTLLGGFNLLTKQISTATKAANNFHPFDEGFEEANNQLAILKAQLEDLIEAARLETIGENLPADLTPVMETVLFGEGGAIGAGDELIGLAEGVAQDAADAADKVRKEAAKKEKQEERQAAAEVRDIKVAAALQGIDAVAQAQAGAFNIASGFIQAELRALEEKNKSGEISEKEFQQKKAELLNKQAKADRAAAITDTIVATALGITAQLKAGPVGFVLAGLAAALGAAQLSLILSQPVPQFAEGTKGTKKAPPGFKWVGEEGPELIHDSGGYDIITAQDSEQLVKILAGYGIPVQFTTTAEDMHRPIRTVDDIIKRDGDKINWNPLLNASDIQRRYLGKKLDTLHYDMLRMERRQNRRMTKN